MLRRLNTFFEKIFFGDRFWGKLRLLGVFLMLVVYVYLVGRTREWDAISGTLAALENASLLLRIFPELRPIYSFIAVFLTWKSLRYVFAPLSGIIGVLMWGAFYVQDIYELRSFKSGWKYLIASLFGFGYPVLTIADGGLELQPDEENLLERIGGPGWVIIHPGNVVLFESLRRPTNVREEGTHFIQRHERVKDVLDLEDHRGHLDSLSAVTKDGVVVTARDVNFRYRLYWDGRTGKEGARTPDKPFPYAVQAVYNAVYNRYVQAGGRLTDWPNTVRIRFEGRIQNYIREHQVDQVTAPREAGINPREAIKRMYESPRFRENLRYVGAQLIWFGIGKLDVEEPTVKEQRITTWAADWKGDAEVIRAYGDAIQQTYVELGRAEANVEILLQIINALEEIPLAGQTRNNIRVLFLSKISQVIYSLKEGGGQDESERIWRFLRSLTG